ncbi:MAG: RDD family protein [Actinobacteria bacterium]|nr:RDD family protein [Actinomycetota bacterium]
MPGQPESTPADVDEVLDPEPGPLEPRRSAPPRQRSAIESAADGVVDLGIRVATPFVRFGWNTARGIGRRLGVSDAVERQVGRALDSDAAARTTERVLETPAANQVWDTVLESEQAQKLVERVAEAPEVRSAITSQGLGLLEDVRQTARRAARRADDELERLVRKALRRPARGQRPVFAGGATRLLAIGMDAAILSGILMLIAAVVSALLNAVFSLGGDNTTAAIAFGALAWWLSAGVYLGIFWILAERTPGMTFMALRISTIRGARVGPRQDLKRLIGFALALIPLGLGFLGILTNERRRGWHDRFADTEVLYADPELDSGLPGWVLQPGTRPAPGPARWSGHGDG